MPGEGMKCTKDNISADSSNGLILRTPEGRAASADLGRTGQT